MFHVKHWIRGLLLLAFVASSGCVSVEESLISGNRRAYGYTWAQEVQIGQESDAAIIAQYGLYDDPALVTYVERVGNAVLAESHLRRPDTPEDMRNTPVTFRLLDSPVVNAFALPGGFVYVTRGLLAHLDNEAQLAMVLGHEVGHIAGRHASKRAAGQQFGQALLVGAAIGGQVAFGGNAAENILGIGGQATQLLFLSYGRDDERESDRVGVEYAALAGYRAGEGAAFFTSLKRISEAAGAEIPSFMSTHPDPGEREQTILDRAAGWESQVAMTLVRRDEYLNAIDGIILGEDPRQGYTEDGRFYHPELAFQFPIPSGYQVVNQPTQVVMVEPNQQAYIVLSIESEAATPEAAGRAFAGQEGLTVVTQGGLRVNGLTAYEVVADAMMENQPIRIRSLYVEYQGTIYAFLALAAQGSFTTYDPAFTSTMRGFAPLTDQGKLNVQPDRLGVVTTNRTAAFNTFLPNRLPRDLDANDLAIINQVDLSTTINQGTRLKLVQ